MKIYLKIFLFLIFFQINSTKISYKKKISSTYLLDKISNINLYIQNLFNPRIYNYQIKKNIKSFLFFFFKRLLKFEAPDYEVKKYYKEIGLNGIIEKINYQVKDLNKFQNEDYNIHLNCMDLRKIKKLKLNDEELQIKCPREFTKFLQKSLRIYLYFNLNISINIYKNKNDHLNKILNFIKFFKSFFYSSHENEKNNFNNLIVEERLIVILTSLDYIILILNNLNLKKIRNFLKKENLDYEDLKTKYKYDFDNIKKFDYLHEEEGKYVKDVKKTVNLKKEIEDFKYMNFNEITKIMKNNFDEINKIDNLNEFGLQLNKEVKINFLKWLSKIKSNLLNLILIKERKENSIIENEIFEKYLIIVKDIYKNINAIID